MQVFLNNKNSWSLASSRQHTRNTPNKYPFQTIQVLLAHVIDRKVTRVDKEQHQAPQSGTVIQFEEKSYSSGRFGHIKDNMDVSHVKQGH